MARLKLNPNVSLKDLGWEVLQAASGRYQNDQAIMDSAQDKINDMFADDDGFRPGNPKVELVYDTPDTAHVVIPYIGDKVVRVEPSIAPEFDFDDLAAETMGFIVIFGCGK